MSKILKLKNKKIVVFIVTLLFMNTFLFDISYAKHTDKILMKSNSTETNDLMREYDLLIEKIDQKIEDLKRLLNELEEKKRILNSLERVQKYVNMDMTSDLDRVRKIAEKTPLDLESAAIVVAYAKKLDLNPSLILAVIKLESNFNRWEVGEDNDRGYMQIIPETEKWLAKKYGHLLGLKYNPNDIFKPEYNIGLGAIYLSILKKAYGNDYHRILSEYNRGPYNLQKYYSKHKTFVTSYSRGVLKREKSFLIFNE